MKIGNKNITIGKFGKQGVQMIYYGSQIVWQALRSCFGLGYWVNKFPWSNKDGWKN